MRKVGVWRATSGEGSGCSESNTESLHTLDLGGLCLRLCVEEGAQGARNLILNSDLLGALWDPILCSEASRRRRD